MKHKLIIALDNLWPREAQNIISKVSQTCTNYMENILFKVNDLLTLKGLEGIKNMIEGTGVRLMLDPKWHDIPNTLVNNFQQLSDSWLWADTEYVTLHASSGWEAIRAGVAARNKLWLTTKILAVTALTSLWEQEVQNVFDESAKHAVLKLAKIALDAGADGIVCSPLEVEVLREVYGEDMIIVNPGVRFVWEDTHDQQRVLTPAETLKNGSTDIVMGRPILEAEDMQRQVERFFDEVSHARYRGNQKKYEFERLLYTGTWKELLSYIGVFYFRPEWGKYCRLASGTLSNAYINIWTIERNYAVVERACRELASLLQEKKIEADLVMWAQMWSVRLSLMLAEKLSVEESVYTEKEGDDMSLKRHDISLAWKKVIIDEDIVTKWSTLKKMKQLVESQGGEVVAIVCVGNRYGKNEFEGVPLISCYTPEAFELFWDDETPKAERWTLPRLPEGAQISPKPKNEWESLVKSMRV